MNCGYGRVVFIRTSQSLPYPNNAERLRNDKYKLSHWFDSTGVQAVGPNPPVTQSRRRVLNSFGHPPCQCGATHLHSVHGLAELLQLVGRRQRLQADVGQLHVLLMKRHLELHYRLVMLHWVA